MFDTLRQDVEEAIGVASSATVKETTVQETATSTSDADNETPSSAAILPIAPFKGDMVLVPRILSLYHFFKSMSHVLRLAPFHPEPFIAAMCIAEPSPLTDEIHTALLRYLHLCAESGTFSPIWAFPPVPLHELPAA
jgi:hypothetical protein